MQFLLVYFNPPPHVAEHVDHLDHSDHLPSTAARTKKTNSQHYLNGTLVGCGSLGIEQRVK